MDSAPAIFCALRDAQKDDFWYVWAQEENRRLLSENSSWKHQAHITLQFHKRLAPEAVPSIDQRVLQEGRQHRAIRDSLAKTTEGEQVIVRIDAESLQIADGAMAANTLLASGTAIVAAGYPRQVLDLMRLLEPAMRDVARMQLTVGYAEYTLGNYSEEIGCVRRAMAPGAEPSDRDGVFLHNLGDASELHLGLIDSAAYERRINERAASLTGLGALEARQASFTGGVFARPT